MTCNEIHYTGVWFLMNIIVRHMESHTDSRGEQVLTNAVEALECKEREKYAIHNARSFLPCYFCKLVQTRNL